MRAALVLAAAAAAAGSNWFRNSGAMTVIYYGKIESLDCKIIATPNLKFATCVYT